MKVAISVFLVSLYTRGRWYKWSFTAVWISIFYIIAAIKLKDLSRVFDIYARLLQ